MKPLINVRKIALDNNFIDRSDNNATLLVGVHCMSSTNAMKIVQLENHEKSFIKSSTNLR